jgi:hypothetical protein
MRCVDCGGSFGHGEAFPDQHGDVVCIVCSTYRAPAAPVVATVAKVEAKPVRTRCPHYHVIREFFTVARESGMDTSEAGRDRMRGALGMLLGRRIESRADMSAADWAFATNAVRMNRVWW